jgi:hypothetical protein|tara:strand:- start:3305 stop:3496 length:192 start_codon:yes stop_codon:yes gene_type:complete
MSFLQSISLTDRRRLRIIVKKVHLKNYPTEHINDYEADKLIESFAPNVVEQFLKAGVDSGKVK